MKAGTAGICTGMAMAHGTIAGKPADVACRLLERHGRTFADEIGVDLTSGSPSALFRTLVFALLASARIRAGTAAKAAMALTDAGWASARAMAGASWEDRVRVLDHSGYARYDERTATILAGACRQLLDDYDGDLRRLREAAREVPERERALLQKITGIGPVGADIFLREAQVAWPELLPYVDARARSAAGALGLPTDPGDLAALVPERDVARLVAGLVRSSLAHDAEGIRSGRS